MILASTNDVLGSSHGRKRRRRRTRKKKRAAGRQEETSDDDDSSPTVGFAEEDRTDAEGAPSCPRRILDRSASISQREDNLACALVITMLNGSPDSILDAIANRFEIEVPMMSLRRLGDARFLLILPSAELVERVYNGGRAFISSSLRLHVMRWTRFLGSTAASLSSPVEVDIRGIPAHAWELATAELLLSDHCWIGSTHADTAEHRDVFKVVA